MRQKRPVPFLSHLITIIVLLILAGVSIAMLTGNNGILTQANKAKTETEKATWEERIDLAKLNVIAEKKEPTMDGIIAELKKQDIIDNESQVNTETGDITTNEPTYIISGKLDDYISNVKITISKTPETELAGNVLLKVENVEGIEGIDLDSIDTKTMNETSKKELIKQLDLYYCNNIEGRNFDSFEELLQKWYGGNEEEYWNAIENYNGSLDNAILYLINELKSEVVGDRIENYIISNPDGENSNYYIVHENGTYTFTLKDLNTGKTYNKTVEVSNIDTSKDYVIKANDDFGFAKIVLCDKNENITTFESAYIYFNGDKIDITNLIETRSYNNSNYNYITGNNIEGYLGERGKLDGTYQEFEFIKDGKSYIGWAEIIVEN